MSEIFASHVGKRLKEARVQLGLNQAEAAHLVGVSREHWGRCERGLAVPGGEILAALATAGADVLYILTGQRAGGVTPAPTLAQDEEILLDNYRHSPPDARAAIKAASDAFARPAKSKGKAA